MDQTDFYQTSIVSTPEFTNYIQSSVNKCETMMTDTLGLLNQVRSLLPIQNPTYTLPTVNVSVEPLMNQNEKLESQNMNTTITSTDFEYTDNTIQMKRTNVASTTDDTRHTFSEGSIGNHSIFETNICSRRKKSNTKSASGMRANLQNSNDKDTNYVFTRSYPKNSGGNTSMSRGKGKRKFKRSATQRQHLESTKKWYEAVDIINTLLEPNTKEWKIACVQQLKKDNHLLNVFLKAKQRLGFMKIPFIKIREIKQSSKSPKMIPDNSSPVNNEFWSGATDSNGISANGTALIPKDGDAHLNMSQRYTQSTAQVNKVLHFTSGNIEGTRGFVSNWENSPCISDSPGTSKMIRSFSSDDNGQRFNEYGNSFMQTARYADDKSLPFSNTSHGGDSYMQIDVSNQDDLGSASSHVAFGEGKHQQLFNKRRNSNTRSNKAEAKIPHCFEETHLYVEHPETNETWSQNRNDQYLTPHSYFWNCSGNIRDQTSEKQKSQPKVENTTQESTYSVATSAFGEKLW